MRVFEESAVEVPETMISCAISDAMCVYLVGNRWSSGMARLLDRRILDI